MNRLELDTPVQFIKGVGPARAQRLATLGIETVGDLLEHYPHRHAHRPASTPIGLLLEGEQATVIGEILRIRACGRRPKGTVSIMLVDGTGQCSVTWFNSPYLYQQLHVGLILRLTGKVNVRSDRAAFTNPKFEVVSPDETVAASEEEDYDPVYPANASIESREIARIIGGVLDEVGVLVREFLPADVRRKRKLPARAASIQRMHQPTKPEDVEIARRRLAYEEFFLMQLALMLKRRHRQATIRGMPMRLSDEIDRRIRARFPFKLTPEQDETIDQIAADLQKPSPMNRMLQGDVGSGKTVVALYAALLTVANKNQAAVMAPTEILAEQHYANVSKYLAGSKVRIELLTGGLPKRRRAEVLDHIASGNVDIVVGTHALVEKSVQFESLGLVVVDEQHKFGVIQRATVRGKGIMPHYLVMTATPIPRTLAMTVFGDLDVSVIRSLPPGRHPIDTRFVPEGQSNTAWSFARHRLAKGEQVFVVYPLVEESDQTDLRAATTEHERLQKEVFADYRVGLLHGRLKAAEKEEGMNAFHNREYQVMVATTVVEVGVDVPNATVMIIEHAERYGLSQLHQLRGRIGRGDKPSTCFLISSSRDPVTLQRLHVMCATNDGFRIAEEDLRLRGPGELFGTRQHGLPEFKVARIVEDFELLTWARQDAAELVARDASLADPRHADLLAVLRQKYQDTVALIDVA